MDYLSYLTMKEKHHPGRLHVATERDYIILNSVANLPKALDLIGSYETKYCYLDNDKAGRDALLTINNRCGLLVSDQSVHYHEYRDLNDCLCGKKIEQTPIKKRDMKL